MRVCKKSSFFFTHFCCPYKYVRPGVCYWPLNVTSMVGFSRFTFFLVPFAPPPGHGRCFRPVAGGEATPGGPRPWRCVARPTPPHHGACIAGKRAPCKQDRQVPPPHARPPTGVLRAIKRHKRGAFTRGGGCGFSHSELISKHIVALISTHFTGHRVISSILHPGKGSSKWGLQTMSISPVQRNSTWCNLLSILFCVHKVVILKGHNPTIFFLSQLRL